MSWFVGQTKEYSVMTFGKTGETSLGRKGKLRLSPSIENDPIENNQRKGARANEEMRRQRDLPSPGYGNHG